MNDYELYSLVFKDEGKYFRVYRGFREVIHLDIMEAVFIQDVFNLGTLNNNVKDNFFLCTRKYLSDYGFMWPKDTQIRLIKSLVRKGYMEVKMVGIPPKRWIRVVMPKIVKELGFEITCTNDPEGGAGNPANCAAGNLGACAAGFAASNKKEINKKEGGNAISTKSRTTPLNSNHSSNGESSKKMSCAARLTHKSKEITTRGLGLPLPEGKKYPDPFCVWCAKRLHEILVRGGYANSPVGWSKRRWAEHIRLLRDVDLEGESDLIEVVLDWYEEAISTIQRPTIHSAKGFRKLFDWFLDERNKSLKPKTQSSKKHDPILDTPMKEETETERKIRQERNRKLQEEESEDDDMWGNDDED